MYIFNPALSTYCVPQLMHKYSGNDIASVSSYVSRFLSKFGGIKTVDYYQMAIENVNKAIQDRQVAMWWLSPPSS
nr:AlNc14C309G10485 [Albugo laibachii Nc14]|eukprot:CCA25644.1 AlNc14C309G10485 [Albugo laibachii Nc14]